MGLLQRADEGIGPYGDAADLRVGADAHIRPLVQTPMTATVARSEAERAEIGVGQMRSCNPLTSVPAPRKSAIKPVPHHAAPVGEPSRTRRHHLTPTLVFKQTCTFVQVCAEHFFFSTGRGAFSF